MVRRKEQFPNEGALDRFIMTQVMEYNDKFENRAHRGFNKEGRLSYRVGIKRVSRIMKINGIRADYRQPKKDRQRAKQTYQDENLLNRQFKQEKPNQVWVTQVYFAHAYSPHERGSNENRNRVLRRFIPKGQAIEELSDYQLVQINWYLNSRPLKCLNWHTSNSKFSRGIGQKSLYLNCLFY